jgi:hypothetical protein
MKFLLLLALAAPVAFSMTGCANDSYDDPTYRLQHNLYERNQKWENFTNRQAMRRNARDSRYQAWFNSVMQ